MADDVVLYATSGPIATITLNRPDKANVIRADVAVLLDDALRTANRDKSVKVIVLEGAGDNFCAGFDFSGGLEHHRVYEENGYDPGLDMATTINRYTNGIEIFMGLWRGLKPTIAKVQGYCLGAGVGARPLRRPRGRRPRRPLRHALLPGLGLPPQRHVGVPTRPGQGEVLRPDRRVDQRQGGRRHRADQRLPPPRRPRHRGRRPRPEARVDPPVAARRHEAHRQPGLRQHGPPEHPDPRPRPRRHHAQHP